jgi:hypothetical protein
MSNASEFIWRINLRALEAYGAAQQCSNWAIGYRDRLPEGMNVEDVERARIELRRALRLLDEVIENARARGKAA